MKSHAQAQCPINSPQYGRLATLGTLSSGVYVLSGQSTPSGVRICLIGTLFRTHEEIEAKQPGGCSVLPRRDWVAVEVLLKVA